MQGCDDEKRIIGCIQRVSGTSFFEGKSDDAKKAWLQVVHTNEGAYKLYDGLGFKKVYTYRYLRKE